MNKKIIIVIGVLLVGIVLYMLAVVILFSPKQSTTSDISKQTAPPYDGLPVVAFDDKTDGELYRAIGGEKFTLIKYYIGDYLSTVGVPKNPVPVVEVSKYHSDMEYLGQPGQYNNLYLFDVYSASINKNFSVKVSESTAQGKTTASIEPNTFIKNLDSYSKDY